MADTFGSGANSFSIDFVTIGNPGNPPDANPNPAGAVDYEYRIGKYEISEQMIDKANAESASRAARLISRRTRAGPIIRRRAFHGTKRRSSSTGSIPRQARYRRTSSTPAAVFNCGYRRILVTTRRICTATNLPHTSCRASTSGTRLPTTTHQRGRTTHIQPAAIACRMELILWATQTSRQYSTTVHPMALRI